MNHSCLTLFAIHSDAIIKLQDMSLNGKKVMVTGATGYIAGWIIKYLLEEGADVKASVRNKSNSEKYAHLTAIDSDSPGTLEMFEADLLDPQAFHEAMKGIEILFHTASPFRITGIRDVMKDLIQPAVDGTRHVLDAATQSGTVKRVVLTSSLAAIYGDARDAALHPKGYLDERDWNTTCSASYQPYSYSKTAAERKAWEMAEVQQQWNLVTINPGLVLGPSLTKRTDSTSIDIMISLASGKYRTGIPDLHFAVADVRDIARAHLLAAQHAQAKGRHIIAGPSQSMLEITQTLRKQYGNSLPLPGRTIPNFLLYLAGPLMGFSWKYLRNNIGYPLPLSNEKSRKELGLVYTDIQDTLRDHIAQLRSDELIKT